MTAKKTGATAKAKPTLKVRTVADIMDTIVDDALAEKVFASDGGNLATVRGVPVDLLDSNPFQPRKTFDEESLNELAASLKAHGQLQPIVAAVGGHDGRLVIVCGERRVMAARKLGWIEIEAKVYPGITERQLQMFALAENVNRENLYPSDISASYASFLSTGGTIGELVALTGFNQSTVSRYLKIGSLATEVIEAAKENRLSFRRLCDLAYSDFDVATQLRLIDLWVSGAAFTVSDVKGAMPPASPKKEKAEVARPRADAEAKVNSPAPGDNFGGKTKWAAQAIEPHNKKPVLLTVVVQARRKEIPPLVLREGLAKVIQQSYREEIDVAAALRRAADEIEANQTA